MSKRKAGQAKKEKKVSKVAALSEETKKKAHMYFKKGMSSREIARVYDTYGKKIERELKAAGFKLRTRSEAQSSRIKLGKCEHPTKGLHLSQETKEKISDKIHEAWSNIDEKEMERRKAGARERLNNRADKDDMIRAGFKGIHKAAKDGSKLEKYLADQLTDAGYMVLVHQKHAIEAKKMHLDILLPDLFIAIEIDGPSHWSNVWSESDLEKSRDRDSIKNGLLLSNKYDVIRLKSPKNVSNFFSRQAATELINTVKKIEGSNSRCKIHRIDLV